MAIPATSVLDDFNRANENPLSNGGKWTVFPALITPGINLSLTSNVATIPSGGGAASYWNPTTFGPNVECYATIAQFDTAASPCGFRLMVSSQAPGTQPSDAYQFTINTGDITGHLNPITLARANGGTVVTSSVTTFVLVNNVTRMLLRAADYGEGMIVSGWLYGTHPDGHVGWVRYLAFRDYAPLGAGYIGAGMTFNSAGSGVRTNMKLDDFGGGTYTPSTDSLSADWTGYTGVLSDDLMAPVKAPHHGFHEGNVAGVLPDPLSDDVAQRASHSGWVDRSGGGAAGVAGV